MSCEQALEIAAQEAVTALQRILTAYSYSVEGNPIMEARLSEIRDVLKDALSQEPSVQEQRFIDAAQSGHRELANAVREAQEPSVQVTDEMLGYTKRPTQGGGYVTVSLAVLEEVWIGCPPGDSQALVGRVLDAALSAREGGTESYVSSGMHDLTHGETRTRREIHNDGDCKGAPMCAYCRAERVWR